jgi:hypothetical protein
VVVIVLIAFVLVGHRRSTCPTRATASAIYWWSNIRVIANSVGPSKHIGFDSKPSADLAEITKPQSCCYMHNLGFRNFACLSNESIHYYNFFSSRVVDVVVVVVVGVVGLLLSLSLLLLLSCWCCG